jgi:hypothetical protein
LAAIITVRPSPAPRSKKFSPGLSSASSIMRRTTGMGLGTKGAMNTFFLRRLGGGWGFKVCVK